MKFNAQNVKTINFTYDLSSFTYDYAADSSLTVYSQSVQSFYIDDDESLALPMFYLSVLVTKGQELQDFSITYDSIQVKQNVIMANSPHINPINIGSQPKQKSTRFIASKYPLKNANYSGTVFWGDYKIIQFIISPFTFIAENNSLFFNSNFELTITLNDSTNNEISYFIKDDLTEQLVRENVVNPEDMALYLEMLPSLTEPNETPVNRESYDYIIVTNETLKPSFARLVEWKTTKGVKTKIITLEEILGKYENTTFSTPYKIKLTLYNEFTKKLNNKDGHALQYVLLGGDDSVIPTQYCQGSYYGRDSLGRRILVTKSNIPTDLYYSTLTGQNNLSWDGNRNGILGEVNEGINFTPSVSLTRLPVRTNEEVIVFVNRILQYEKDNLADGWKNNMLMVGNELDTIYIENNVAVSDAQYKGDYIYEKYIQPNWHGTIKKFYDTWTDFSGRESYDLSANNLQYQLASGYNFVNIMTHGDSTIWALETDWYTREHAYMLNSSIPMIITTSACLTNAYDSEDDPCLSEALLRNANCNVLGYFGPSREGLFVSGKTIDQSNLYNAEFYKALFTGKHKNFGTIIRTAITKLIVLNKRWVFLSTNACGDPEMPIYTEIPNTFSQCSININGDSIDIHVGVDSANVCIMSYNDLGASFYEVLKDTSDISITRNIPDSICVCITKQGYVPLIHKYIRGDLLYIQNEVIEANNSYISKQVQIGNNVTNILETGDVTVRNGKSTIKAKESVFIKNGFEVKRGAEFEIRIE
ncbi:MAG: hypothetical protein IJK87_00295 [Prevotella sp.]|nr:hypothetical protein [Prevotella sp.]